MKSSDVKLNSMMWSRSQNAMGQSVAKMNFMVLLIFAHQPRLWLPAADLEYDYDKL